MAFLVEQLFRLAGVEVEPGLIITLRVLSVVSVVLFILYYATMWRLYQKAGRHGWAAIVPVYQFWVLADITARKNILWFILSMVPATSFVAWVYMMFELPKRFGKSDAFAAANVVFGVFILPFVAFGKAQYLGNIDRSR